jgi:hypothetical protein
MAFAIYTARRGVVSYHTIEEPYHINFQTSVVTRPDGGDIKVVQESLTGRKETQFYGEKRIWSLTTIPIQLGSAAEGLILEFLRSTADGQTFQLDPYGFDGAAVHQMSVTREDSAYAESLFKEIDGVTDYVQYAFQVREF